MAHIDQHRASYARPNLNIVCGLKDKAHTLTPSTSVDKTVTYHIEAGGKRYRRSTISEVNQLLLISPSAKVVKSTRVVTTETTHQRLR